MYYVEHEIVRTGYCLFKSVLKNWEKDESCTCLLLQSFTAYALDIVFSLLSFVDLALTAGHFRKGDF